MPIVGAFATSHAYTFQEPETWDQRRVRSKTNVAKKAGRLADDTPQAKAETLEDNRERYKKIRNAHEEIRRRLKALEADAVLLIGDDQTENFGTENIPQFLIYTGGDYLADDWDRKHSATIRNNANIARTLVEGVMEEGFDVSWATQWKDGKLLSHAHTEPILYLVGDSAPVVPVFVNAVHPPAPSPSRCHEFGRALGRVGEHQRNKKRFFLGPPGGLSPFPPPLPGAHNGGSRCGGDISVDFDRRIVAWMQAGLGHRLAELTSRELI